MTGLRRTVAIVASVLLLASCQSSLDEMSSYGDGAQSVSDTSVVDYYANDQLVAAGKVQFRERNYGKSYQLYKKAVEVMPEDPEAWLGYAASSDYLGRFDNADRAYRKLGGMVGSSPVYLNNVGYSYLLRGNLLKARDYFLRAYEIDPSNEVTANNLELLRNSATFAKRG